MTTPTLYLHIGQTKTATTTLQHFFHTNTLWLKQHGVLYPQRPQEPESVTKHHHLPESLSHAAGINPEPWRRMLAEANEEGLGKVLVSDEVFWHVHAAHPERRGAALLALARLLEGVDIRVMCWLRRQDRWVESWFSQMSKAANNELSRLSFSAFLEAQRSMGMFDYAAILDDWARAFGKERLLVRSFEKTQLKDQDVIADFAMQLGIGDLKGTVKPPDKQVAFSRPACLLLNQFNAKAGSETHRQQLKRVLRPRPGDALDTRRLMTPACALGLIESNAEGNQRITELYRGGVPLFTDLKVHDDAAVYDSLTHDDRESLLARLRKAGVDTSWAEAELPAKAAPRPARTSATLLQRTAGAHRGPALQGSLYLYCLAGHPPEAMHTFLAALGYRGFLPNAASPVRHHEDGDSPPEWSREQPVKGPLNGLRRMPDGHYLMGEFSPLLIPTALLEQKRLSVVAAKRHPKELLYEGFKASYKRPGADPQSSAQMSAEFVAYMRQQAALLQQATLQHLLYTQVSTLAVYRQLNRSSHCQVIDTDILAARSHAGQAAAFKLAKLLRPDTPDDAVMQAHDALVEAAALARTPSLDVWTDNALDTYAALGFADMEKQLGY